MRGGTGPKLAEAAAPDVRALDVRSNSSKSW